MTVLLGTLEQLPCWQLAPSAQPAHFMMCKVKWQACMQLCDMLAAATIGNYHTLALT